MPPSAPPSTDAAPLAWRIGWFAVIVGTLYAGYQVLNRWHLRPPALLPLTALDRAIPLLPWTIWPYLVLAGCVGLVLALRRRSTFRRAMRALVIGYPIDLLIFAVFPTTYPRVADVPGAGLNELAFNFLFAIDTPANCFPSGHITAPFIAFWALAEENPRARLWLWPLFAALSVTILTTKQHYVADLLGGLATGVFGVWMAWRPSWERGALAPRDGGAAGARNDGLPPARIPRPRFNLGVINLLAFRRDPLRFLQQLTAECGPVCSCRLAWHRRFVVNDPALARSILDLPPTGSNKSTRSVAALRRICGESVLTADRESWFRLRRVVQPAFHRPQIEQHVETMTALAAAMLAGWRRDAADGRPIELAREMRRLTFRFVGKALFHADPSDEIARLERDITTALEATWREIQSPFTLLPPTQRPAFTAAMAGIDAFVARLIAERRAAPEAHPDLLSILLAARDADTGAGLTDAELRNECVTLLIAGYDTTANALAWALLELARHPAAAARLRREVADALEGRAPRLADLPRLGYARAVFLETLRLHPPIWIMERNLERPVSSGPWSLPAGAQVLITPSVLHRLPEHWDNPDAFAPERFLAGAGRAEENPAYLPFGTGPRTCVGRQLALLEGQVFLAVIAQAGRWRTIETREFAADAGISLRPAGEPRIQFEPVAAAGVGVG